MTYASTQRTSTFSPSWPLSLDSMTHTTASLQQSLAQSSIMEPSITFTNISSQPNKSQLRKQQATLYSLSQQILSHNFLPRQRNRLTLQLQLISNRPGPTNTITPRPSPSLIP